MISGSGQPKWSSANQRPQAISGPGQPKGVEGLGSKNIHLGRVRKLKMTSSKKKKSIGKNMALLRSSIGKCTECDAERHSTQCYCPQSSQIASQHRGLTCSSCRSILVNNIICSLNKSCTNLRSKMLRCAEQMITKALLQFQAQKLEEIKNCFEL